jgi:hypothetical protein
MNEDFKIREADERDFPETAKFLNSLNFGPRKLEWLRWKYLENPEGRNRIFVVTDSIGNIKGFLGFIPRHFMNGSAEGHTLMQAVDGILAPEIRGKGIYTKLLEYSASKMRHPLLGFPNHRAEHVHLQCNWKRLSPEKRWEFPCAIGKRFRDTRFGYLAPLADFASKTFAAILLGPSPRQIVMRPVQQFMKDYSIRTVGFAGVRSAQYLNWRFIENPMRAYFCHEYYGGDECLGYSVYGIDGPCAEIFDFVVSRRHRKCLKLLVEHCRRAGISHILFRGIGLKLRRYGFLKRRGQGSYIGFGLPKAEYIITLCDSDW